MLHGERLDRPTYALIMSLDGGTSDVYLTSHEIFGIDVVQKTVSLLGIPDGVARSEPRVLEGLRHPHLVRVREAQWDAERDPTLACVTFTTDFYPGRSVLYALESGHAFSTGEVLEVLAGVVSACVYLHDDAGLLHRDIKPGNVMLDESRTHPLLGDLALAAELDTSTRTTGPANATPLYTPPENAGGSLDVRADLYGVGCVGLEMLNGVLPYAAIDRDKVAERLADGKRALVNRMYDPAPWVPPKVASFLRKLLAEDPGRRFTTAREALRALRHIRCVSWRRTSGIDLLGTWEGTYPPNVPRSRQRVHEIMAEEIESGPYKGKVKLSARWRNADNVNWRGHASLTRRVEPDDSRALASFFRDVEALAHSAPVS